MGRVIPFSEVESFVGDLVVGGGAVRAILDTNVLIAASYEIKDEHDEISVFLEKLKAAGITFYATVTTKAEFIEFHRRLLLTEALMDLSDEASRFRLPRAALEEIRKAHASVKSKQARDGSDPIFNDSQIKRIKSEFSAGNHSGHLGWIRLCEKFIKGYVRQVERQLADRGITYLSPNEATQADFFIKKLEWPAVASLVEKTGLSVSDAMILNMLNSSVCQFALSLDFDFGFAVLADAESKDAFMPDRMEREYRHSHFDSEGRKGSRH